MIRLRSEAASRAAGSAGRFMTVPGRVRERGNDLRRAIEHHNYFITYLMILRSRTPTMIGCCANCSNWNNNIPS